MADKRKSAKLTPFAHGELEKLVSDLGTTSGLDVGPQEVLGSLILAARSAPLELVAALMPSYVRREKAEPSLSQPPAPGADLPDDHHGADDHGEQDKNGD